MEVSPARAARFGVLLPVGVVTGVTALVLGLTGSLSSAQPAPPTPRPSASPAATPAPQEPGRRILYLRDCAWCHGADGEGSFSGPSLEGVGAMSADFMLTTGRMPIPQPDDQPRAKPPVYTKEQIDEIVGYVASFGPGPAIPRVNTSSVTLGEGEELYEVNCAACHSSTGIGGALTNGLEAPTLLNSTARQAVEAMRLGGAGLRSGNMPKFGPDTLSDEQVAAIAKYVLYLRNPQNRGGQDLGRIGPVVEGFMAWLCALLLLVIFVRWVGTKAKT
jgi:ubiquinol-cytochrome c reductase cytochrome c subunit